MLFGSCTVVKNYPIDKPFVFSNQISIGGLVSKDQAKTLQSELQSYWDDSLKVAAITQFGIRTIIKNPNPFDSSHINPSMVYMNSYLNSQGYYNANLSSNVDTVVVNDQQRVSVTMNIDLGKKLSIDTFNFNFLDSGLQQVAMEHKKQTLLARGKPYSKQLIASELDRLVTLFRNNGYYNLVRENLQAELDTTDVSLLEVILDPFEQARIISEAAERRRVNPVLDINIIQRDSTDTISPIKYEIGKVYYYPQAPLTAFADSLIVADYKFVETQREMTSKQDERFINFRPLREHTYLKEGTVFDERNYFKTVNALTQMGPWSQVDAKIIERNDSVPTLDFHLLLSPASKYSFNTDLEVSRNTGTIIAGNLLGLANNITLRNRNVWKSGIQSSTTLRNGIELGFCDTCVLLQTFQSSISQTYSIPRFITPFRIRGVKKLDDYKTLVNLNASYTERRNFFRFRSIVGSWGYEWKRKNHFWLYRPLNVELYNLDALPGLLKAFETNAFLRTAFNTGYVVSQSLTYNYTFTSPRHPNVSNYIRLSGEEAGALLGRIPALQDKIYQYLKLEGEFRQIIKLTKTEFAYRFFGGIGINYGNDPLIGQTLPFFKQFVAGGPNSMRAWNLRQLGLGSSLLGDTSSTFKDRYGDIQLETNLEYRFPLATVSGVKIGSALFADLGNIWNLKGNTENPKSQLQWDRLWRDIAIGVGTGLRADFNYFLIRLDFAYKVKDPARLANNGWMSFSDFKWRNDEFPNRSEKRNNYALQIGIGLPF